MNQAARAAWVIGAGAVDEPEVAATSPGSWAARPTRLSLRTCDDTSCIWPPGAVASGWPGCARKTGCPRCSAPRRWRCCCTARPASSTRPASAVAYGCGLRVSEVTHLKVADIDSARILIRVEQGKGRKDRDVMLAPDLLELLRRCWRSARRMGWLFPGRDPGQPITARYTRVAIKTLGAVKSPPSLLRPPPA